MNIIQHDKIKRDLSKEIYNIQIETGEITRASQNRKRKVDSRGTWYYLGFIGEIGFTIALPIAGGALIGRYVDARWATYPKATLSLLFVGIVVSFFGFIRTVQSVIRREKNK
ncbi:AtpZ/AtpI family protein [Patescibacteria group bacterium]|nr:AtpZ/AtpI family protein [Patescibacteria group bacterium]